MSSGRVNSSDEGMSRCLNCARIDRRGDLKMKICKMDKEARRRKWIWLDKKEWKRVMVLFVYACVSSVVNMRREIMS